MNKSRRLQDIDKNALVTRGYKKSAAKYNKYGRTGYKKEIYYKLHPKLYLRRGNNCVDSTSSASINA